MQKYKRLAKQHGMHLLKLVYTIYFIGKTIMEDYNVVKIDFNEISGLVDSKWNHNNCYYNKLMILVPDNVETCLIIGCSKGELSFLLSKKI